VTLEDLRVLVVVADQLNLSAAARALGCTQGAVSQHIRRLEADLGSPLLVRGQRGSVLTAAGERYALAAAEALGALARGRRAVDELANPGLGVLRIATGGSTLRHFMAPAIAAFRADYPATRLELHSAGSTRRCLQAVQRDQADLAFVTLGDPLPGFATNATVESDWTLVEPVPASPRRAGAIGLDELAQFDYISLHPASVSGRELNRQLRNAHIAPAIETTVDDWDTAIALVGLGLGVAIVPALHAVALQPSYRFAMTSISGLAPLRFGWAAIDPRLLPAAAREFAAIFQHDHGQQASPLVRTLREPWQPGVPGPGLPR
jgi:DNA-binding transcriptional LysR family regulator